MNYSCYESKENKSLSVEPNGVVSKNDEHKENRPKTPDFEQQKPCTSKQSNISSNLVKFEHNTNGGNLTSAVQHDDVPISTFYQELLEASYSSDGN